MASMKAGSTILAVMVVVGAVVPVWAEAKPDAAGIEYFEKNVRPVLADSCYECHASTSRRVKGKLTLDTYEGFHKGGESGSLVVKGKPDESLLIKAVRHASEDLQMPPKKKLSDEQIKAMEQWVSMGAPYPEPKGGVKTTVGDIAKAREFWSFVAPKEQAIPAVKNEAWAKTEIDRFILAKLEAKGLAPSAPADKRTLIRRATFDLTGLPPTMEEVKAFEADESPSAFEKVIDRLLASPHYGERWGRYWLDVARYADSKGYVFQEERRYPYAYTYRDWVINALNEDMPYDQFVQYQIAADRMVKENPTDTRHLAAMGFLTLGRRFLNNQPDIIDDRMDVVTRGTMGLTVSCARCHDHKFDPISIKDYYSLYGVFASSNEPRELPLIGDPSKAEAKKEYEAELAKRQKVVNDFLKERHGAIVGKLRSAGSIEAYLIAANEAKSADEQGLRGLAQKYSLRRGLIERFRNQLKASAENKEPVFALWHAYAAIAEKEFGEKAGGVVQQNWEKANPVISAAFAEKPPASLKEVAATYGKILAEHDKAEKLADSAAEEIRLALHGDGVALKVAVGEVEQIFDRDDRDKARNLRNKVEALSATHPGAPARAMVLNDLPNPVEPRVFIRGNAGNPGDQVPRQFLEILSPNGRTPFKEGSGRLELAKLITSPENPLTARVIVNRVWTWHFGQGVVRTPSDFGTRGDAPTHPELLDHLAVRFVKEGWSLKKLHKWIMLSAVYQQSSDGPRDVQVAMRHSTADPENTLLWRFNRRRLDFEATRDSILAVSGELDRSIGGRAVDIVGVSPRRTIYGFIDRQNLPGVFRAFDFASPDSHSPQRFVTTVPQQALFMMNSPFVVERAKKVLEREEIKSAADDRAKVIKLYEFAYARQPSAEEISMALRFVANADAWPRLAQVLLISNEFIFVD